MLQLQEHTGVTRVNERRTEGDKQALEVSWTLDSNEHNLDFLPKLNWPQNGTIRDVRIDFKWFRHI